MKIARKLATLVLIFTLTAGVFPQVAFANEPNGEAWTSWISGDANEDGIVDALDLAKISANFGSPQIYASHQADVNADGFVNALDISEVLQNLCCEPHPPAEWGAVTSIRAVRDTNEIAVLLQTDGTAYLEITIISDTTDYGTYWDEGTILSTGTARINKTKSSRTYVYVALPQELPEYFIVRAVLLAEESIFIEYTRAFENFLSKTIYDFTQDRVIRLDEESIYNNFMVATSQTKLIYMAERTDSLYITGEYEFLFRNAESDIAALALGERLVITCTNGEVFLVYVVDIVTNGADITVIDSMQYSAGIGVPVVNAAKMYRDGKSKEEIS